MQQESVSTQSTLETAVAEDEVVLFDRYGHLIFSYIRKYTQNVEDAEDLTLEVFTAALEKNDLSHIPAEEQLAWLKRVTHNKLIDTYRKASRSTNIALDIFIDTLHSNEDPEQIALRNESYSQLHQHIQKLPPLKQKILYLRYVHGLSCAEIGVLLNKTDLSIRQLLTRTRALLRGNYRAQE